MDGFNLWAALAAAASAFLLGGPWYSPVLFLKPRLKATEQGDAPKGDARHPARVFGVSFVAASFGINYQFADRGFALWAIDGGYHLAQFTLYGLILGLWG